MSNKKGAPRLKWSVSIYKLVQETGIKNSTLRRIMIGVHSPRIDHAKKIIDTINELYDTNLTVDEVFGGVDIPIEICSEHIKYLTI